jgi:hypothetical protein
VGARRSRQITERDREVLGLLAEHRVLVLPQIAATLAVSDRTAADRLRDLRELRLIGYDAIFRDQPAAVWITRRGLGAIESRLPPPGVDLKGYRHDIGVGWLWLSARRGAFGPLATLVSEREMRSHDLRSDRTGEPFGVALGGFDSHGRMNRHYPDLLLTTTAGARVAIELELTAKTGRRLDTIMRGYAGDGRIDSVLYLVPNASLERSVAAAVARAGIPDLVRVARMASPVIEGAPEPGARGLAGGRALPVVARTARSPAALGSGSPTGRGSRSAGVSPSGAQGPAR